MPQEQPSAAELRSRVGLADVDPYLIHWSAYPRLMDRGASAVVVPALSREWLRDGHHVGVSAFHCAYERPVSLGDALALRSQASAVARDRVHVHHTVECDGRRVAVGTTEHAATLASAGWRPVDFPGVDGFARRPPSEGVPGDDDAPVDGGHAVSLSRRVHLRQVDTAALHWLSWVEWVDEGLSSLFAATGHPISRLHAERIGFPLVTAEGRLQPGVGLDDDVTVESAVERVGRTSVTLAHRLCAATGQRVAWARTSHVCVASDRFQPVAVPEWMR